MMNEKTLERGGRRRHDPSQVLHLCSIARLISYQLAILRRGIFKLIRVRYMQYDWNCIHNTTCSWAIESVTYSYVCNILCYETTLNCLTVNSVCFLH